MCRVPMLSAVFIINRNKNEFDNRLRRICISNTYFVVYLPTSLITRTLTNFVIEKNLPEIKVSAKI